MAKDGDIWIKYFEETAKEPISWLGKATQLIHDANLVLHKGEDEGPLKGIYRSISTYMMLNSYAIEDILKAIIIIKNPNYINNGSIHDKLINHKLIKLTEIAEVKSFSQYEEDLLNRLSTFAIYAGKYPVPKSWTTHKDSLSEKGTGPHRTIFMSHDLNDIIDIINKLQDELKKLGISYDLYDMSYTYKKDGKEIFVKKRIQPHQYPHGRRSD